MGQPGGRGGRDAAARRRSGASRLEKTSAAVPVLLAIVVLAVLGSGATFLCIGPPRRSTTARGTDSAGTTGAPSPSSRPEGITAERPFARSLAPARRGATRSNAAGASGGNGLRPRGLGPAGALLRDDPAAGGATGTPSGGAPCSGFGCANHACASGSTTVSGTIYDPAGKRPLYGVVAYVPNTQPEPFAPGASCTACTDLYTGDPVASAVTDAAGRFVIQNAPDGVSIPLVIQVGRWRRQFVLPSVGACANTAVPDGTLTLPKNGSEGDLPNIAISTGSSDSIECLLSRIGVDRAEYVGGASGAGHIHVFKGDAEAPDASPGSPHSAEWLWDSASDIMRYDMVVLSCTGYEPKHINQQVLFDYAAAGGRVFASHSHYVWFATGPFGARNLAAWTNGQHQAGTSFVAGIATTTWGNQLFPRGEAFYEWLSNVGALAGGGLPLESPPSYNAYVTAANAASQPWIVADKNPASPSPTLAFSFDTPLGAAPADQCGRVVFSDMHVGLKAGDYDGPPGKITPAGCATKELSPQEKAVEFILFDLASCVTPVGASPQAPTN
jgi:hypothetical protein